MPRAALLFAAVLLFFGAAKASIVAPLEPDDSGNVDKGMPLGNCTTFPNATACNLSPQCQWNSIYGICTPICKLIADSATCTENPSCVFNDEGCVMRCNLFSMSPAECEANNYCAWLPSQSTCVPQSCRTSYPNATACDASGVCAWDSAMATCFATCKFYTSEYVCDEVAACFWNAGRSLCQLVPTIPPETTAAPLPPPPPPSTRPPSPPGPTPPAEDCASYGSDLECSTSPFCEWYAALNVCQRTCETVPTAFECFEQPGCYYADGVCQNRCELDFTTKDECHRLPHCKWHRNSDVCGFSCASVSGAQCFATGICHYLPASDSCVPYCTAFATPVECNAQFDCTWSPTVLTCGSK